MTGADTGAKVRWVDRAVSDATAGSLVLAYARMLENLDLMMTQGAWEDIATDLRRAIDGHTRFAVGMARIAANCHQFIPEWSSIMADLRARVADDGRDPRDILRGIPT